MIFLIRYSLFVLLVGFALRIATDSWVKYNTKLMIGMIAIAGFIFLV